jgi:AcrR family transcriptional regulator
MNERIALRVVETLGGSQPVRRDAAENRRRILQEARLLFAARGVAAVTMANIAEAAGVGKGTLYRRFANKGELCYALMDQQLAEFQNDMLAQLQSMAEARVPWLEQLTFFLDAVVGFTEQHVSLLCEVQSLVAETGNSNIELPHFWQYMTVNALLQAAAEDGELSAELDLALTADFLLAPLNASFYRFLRQVRGFTPERIGESLGSLVLQLSE